MTKLIAKLLDLVSLIFFPGTNIVAIDPQKSDYPERSKNEVFSREADEVISTPSKITRKPVGNSTTAKRDQEFWETL